MDNNFLFEYMGRKKLYENEAVYNSIDMTGIKNIVEPFGGTFSFSQYLYIRKGLKNLNYHYNDIEYRMYDTFKQLNIFGFPLLNVLCGWYNACRYDKQLNRENKHADIFNYFTENARGCMRFQKKLKKEPNTYLKHIEFIQSIGKITNMTHKDIFDMYKHDPTALIYLDPPYLSSKNGEYYTFGLKSSMDDIIKDIYELAENCKCKIVYVHNDNWIMSKMFDGVLPPVNSYRKVYGTTHRECIHTVRANNPTKPNS